MHVAKFVRTNTTLCPGWCVSVLYIDDGDGPSQSLVEITNSLRSDVDSLDGLAIASLTVDPLKLDGIHKLIMSVKPPKLRSILLTAAEDPDRLDDLVGAGYVDIVDIHIRDIMTPDQMRSLEIIRKLNYDFFVTVDMMPGVIGVDEITEIANQSKGCQKFLMRPFDPQKNRDPTKIGIKPYRKKELESLMSAVKGIVRNPVIVV